MAELPSVSIDTPTYKCEQVLLETLEQLLALDRPADEILVVDQTRHHSPETIARLEQLEKEQSITWRHLNEPSISRAMNLGLQRATGEVVLFLDDDIEVTSRLVEEHARECQSGGVDAEVGQVVQTWQQYQTKLSAILWQILQRWRRVCPLTANRDEVADAG